MGRNRGGRGAERSLLSDDLATSRTVFLKRRSAMEQQPVQYRQWRVPEQRDTILHQFNRQGVDEAQTAICSCALGKLACDYGLGIVQRSPVHGRCTGWAMEHYRGL